MKNDVNAADTPRATKRLPATAMRSAGADYARAYHHVTVEPDVTLEDIKRPNFWAFHVARLNAGDLVDVVSRDFSLDVQMRVIGKGVGYVTMRVLREFIDGKSKAKAPDPRDEDLPELPENYKVVFAPKSGWVVRTIDPAETVATKPTKPEAYAAAIEHSRKALGVAA